MCVGGKQGISFSGDKISGDNILFITMEIYGWSVLEIKGHTQTRGQKSKGENCETIFLDTSLIQSSPKESLELSLKNNEILRKPKIGRWFFEDGCGGR